MTPDERIEELATVVVDVAYKIHSRLGPGLLESIYVKILVHELRKRGLSTSTEVPVDVVWDGENLGVGFRADIIVEDLLVIEVKAAEGDERLHAKQLLTYIRLLDQRLGLLINFNKRVIKQGLKRVIDDFEPGE